MGNPYLERKAKAGIGAAGRANEKSLAKKMGGRLTPASGAVEGFKGDFSVGDFLMEAKSTTAYSMPLKLDWLVKIAGEARSRNKQPGLTVSFTTATGAPVKNGEWVLIPLNLFMKLTSKDE